MKEVVGNVRTVLHTVIELGISLIAVAVILQVLMGKSIWGENIDVVANITTIISGLESGGVAGLLAFGVLLYIFNKKATTTA
jgi:hypothetical protein